MNGFLSAEPSLSEVCHPPTPSDADARGPRMTIACTNPVHRAAVNMIAVIIRGGGNGCHESVTSSLTATSSDAHPANKSPEHHVCDYLELYYIIGPPPPPPSLYPQPSSSGKGHFPLPLP